MELDRMEARQWIDELSTMVQDACAPSRWEQAGYDAG